MKTKVEGIELGTKDLDNTPLNERGFNMWQLTHMQDCLIGM